MYKVTKNRKCTEWSQSELEFLTAQSTLYTTPEAQILVRLTLRLAISEIQRAQGHQKSEMYQITPNWTWTVNGQKYPVYTKHFTSGPNFDPFHSTTSGSQDIAHFIIPHWLPSYTPPPQKKREQRKKKCQKMQILKFHNSLYTFGRDHS